MHIVTKSGSNQFHGSAYGYYRNNSTQAVNFIDQLRTGQEPYSQNVNSGVTAGGPIVKGKLFFFTSSLTSRPILRPFNFLLNSPTQPESTATRQPESPSRVTSASWQTQAIRHSSA